MSDLLDHTLESRLNARTVWLDMMTKRGSEDKRFALKIEKEIINTK